MGTLKPVVGKVFKKRIFLLLFFTLAVKAQTGTWIKEPQNGTLGSGWPVSRNWNRLIYDAYLQRVLMELGTDSCTIMTNSIWNYDASGNGFVLAGAMQETCPNVYLQQSSPPWPGDRHTYGQMAYDTKRSGMWMGMGVDDVYHPNTQTCPDTGHPSGVCNFFDMWFWDSASQAWTYNANFYGQPSQPKSRTESEMEYDPVNDRVVLYGGLFGGVVGADTWIWNPNSKSWSEGCSNCAPGKKEAASIVWDSVKKQILMFGGQAIYGGPQNATATLWYYNTATNVWMQVTPSGPLPPAVRFPAVAFDTSLGVLVYHAGPDQLWTYNPTTNMWTHADIAGGPSYGGVTSQSTSMAYDASQDVIVVHDFGKGNGGPADIWTIRLQ